MTQRLYILPLLLILSLQPLIYDPDSVLLHILSAGFGSEGATLLN